MNSISGYDKWLTTPPDEPEAVFCIDCGDEMGFRCGCRLGYYL